MRIMAQGNQKRKNTGTTLFFPARPFGDCTSCSKWSALAIAATFVDVRPGLSALAAHLSPATEPAATWYSRVCQTPSWLQHYILIISREREREKRERCGRLRQHARYQSLAFLHSVAAGPFRGHVQHNGFSTAILGRLFPPSIWALGREKPMSGETPRALHQPCSHVPRRPFFCPFFFALRHFVWTEISQ